MCWLLPSSWILSILSRLCLLTMWWSNMKTFELIFMEFDFIRLQRMLFTYRAFNWMIGICCYDYNWSMISTTIPVNCLKLSKRSLWLDSMDKVMHEIVTAFYIGNWLNDLDPMQINNDFFLYRIRFSLPLIAFMEQSC